MRTQYSHTLGGEVTIWLPMIPFRTECNGCILVSIHFFWFCGKEREKGEAEQMWTRRWDERRRYREARSALLCSATLRGELGKLSVSLTDMAWQGPAASCPFIFSTDDLSSAWKPQAPRPHSIDIFCSSSSPLTSLLNSPSNHFSRPQLTPIF
jgi:hypothetical protein